MGVTGELTYWERVAETRWGAYITQMEHRLITDALFVAGTPSEALEVGCEGGRWSKMLADAGWMMTCTDINEASLGVCRDRIPDARLVLVRPSDTALPCDSHQMGLLLCIEVADAVNRDWFFPEASRVLRPGGLLVITCLNRLSWRGLYALLRDGASACYQRTYLSSRRNLRKSGFALLRQEGFAWAPFSRSSDSRLVPFSLRPEAILGLRRVAALSPWVGVVARKLFDVPAADPMKYPA